MIENGYVTKEQINYLETIFNFLNNSKGCIVTHEVIYLLNYLLGDNIYNSSDDLIRFTSALSACVENDDFYTFLGMMLSTALYKYNVMKESEENE